MGKIAIFKKLNKLKLYFSVIIASAQKAYANVYFNCLSLFKTQVELLFGLNWSILHSLLFFQVSIQTFKLLKDKFKIKILKESSHLKWSCSETLKSNESDLSTNPIPINAVRPASYFILITKYRAESDTLSIAVPGYESTGHAAKSSPLKIRIFCF